MIGMSGFDTNEARQAARAEGCRFSGGPWHGRCELLPEPPPVFWHVSDFDHRPAPQLVVYAISEDIDRLGRSRYLYRAWKYDPLPVWPAEGAP